MGLKMVLLLIYLFHPWLLDMFWDSGLKKEKYTGFNVVNIVGLLQ